MTDEDLPVTIDQDLLNVIEEREDLIAVLEEILETGLPRNRGRAEHLLKKIRDRDEKAAKAGLC